MNLVKGTTFKIYLPRVDEPLEESKGRGQEEELPQGSETILIVEDDEEVRKLAARVLEKQGYMVLDGSKEMRPLLFVEKYKGPIHMVCDDVVMPGMGGRELTERRRIPSSRDESALYVGLYGKRDCPSRCYDGRG